MALELSVGKCARPGCFLLANVHAGVACQCMQMKTECLHPLSGSPVESLQLALCRMISVVLKLAHARLMLVSCHAVRSQASNPGRKQAFQGTTAKLHLSVCRQVRSVLARAGDVHAELAAFCGLLWQACEPWSRHNACNEQRCFCLMSEVASSRPGRPGWKVVDVLT